MCCYSPLPGGRITRIRPRPAQVINTCNHHQKAVYGFVWCGAYSMFASCGLERDVILWQVRPACHERLASSVGRACLGRVPLGPPYHEAPVYSCAGWAPRGAHRPVARLQLPDVLPTPSPLLHCRATRAAASASCRGTQAA